VGSCQLWERSDISLHFADRSAGGAGRFGPSPWLAMIQVEAGANIACHLRGAGNCIGIIRFVALLVFVLSTSRWGVDPYCCAL
jgi:hypothetical protein